MEYTFRRGAGKIETASVTVEIAGTTFRLPLIVLFEAGEGVRIVVEKVVPVVVSTT